MIPRMDLIIVPVQCKKSQSVFYEIYGFKNPAACYLRIFKFFTYRFHRKDGTERLN